MTAMAIGDDVELDYDVVELVACPGQVHHIGPVHRLGELAFRADSWAPSEISALRTKFFADERIDDIADTIGRSLSAVRSRLFEMGLRRNSARPWAEMEDQLVLDKYGVIATATIASMLGRTVSAVYARAYSLGLGDSNAPLWSAWEDAQLAEGYKKGMPALQLASLIGRPISGAVSRASLLGLKHKNWNPAWTEPEKVLAATLAEQGCSARDIGLAFERHGLIPRTKNAVGQMLKALGFERSWGRPWLPEEVTALRRAYAEGASVAKLAYRLGRSRTSLMWKAGELQLTGTHANGARGFRQGNDWSPEELVILRTRYGTEKVKDTAAVLNRPIRGIYCKAHALGLDTKFHREWSKEDDRAIAIAYSAGVSMTDLAGAIGRDIATVSKRAIKLGIRFSDRPIAASRGPRGDRPIITLDDILTLGALPEHQWACTVVAPPPKRKGRTAALDPEPASQRDPESIKILRVPSAPSH